MKTLMPSAIHLLLSSTLAAAAVLASVSAAHAQTDERAFVDAVVSALVDSDYAGDDLESAASIQAGRNYSFDCSEFRAAVLSGQDLLEGSAVGFAFGVSDALAQIHCYVGNPLCACLRDWPVGHSADFGRIVGAEIATCQGGRAAAGAVQQAILGFCR